MLETFQIILQLIGVIFLAITSAGSIKYLIDSYNRWALRKKIQRLSRKVKDKAITTEEKKKIKEEIQKISIKQHFRSSARNILEGTKNKINLQKIENYLWSFETELRNLNQILKRFKGYRKELESQYSDDFVNENNEKGEEPQQ